MPKLVHNLTIDNGWGRETRTWEHEEGEKGAYETYVHDGYLKLVSRGPASGERHTEYIPWSIVKHFTVSRVRSRRK